MKKLLGPANALYPSLTTLVGAHVGDKPNFMTIAHVGILNHGRPQYLSIGCNKQHLTNSGILEHGEFSINVPNEDMLEVTDYVGVHSGKRTDKSGLFDVFYGQLAAAPLITACPVAMACRLEKVIDMHTHDIFIGEVVETWADEAVLTGNRVDVAKVRPLLFDMASVQYWSLGKALGRCWRVGRDWTPPGR